MSQSRSPKAPLYVSTSPTDFMAEALVAPTPAHLPASFYQRRRTPPPVHLPPLSIPSAPRSEPTEVESPHVRLPSLQAIAPRPQGEQDVTATQQERARPARRGAPLADILSPQPSTPARSEVGISPSYVVRGSSPQRFVEATSAGRYFYGRQVDSDTSPGDGRFEPSYTSPVEAPPYPRPATALSPTQTSGLETGLQYQASRAAQYFPSESSRPSAARLGSYGIPQQPTSAAGTFSPTVKSNNGRLQYELVMRQQPAAARACGFGERDRRVIDPPPIIQLIARDARNAVVKLDEFRCSHHIVHCTLVGEDGVTDQSGLQQADRPPTRRLMGQLVASPSVAKDEHDVEGCFFCFPDLSCRTHGRYRLRFVLIRLDPSRLRPGSQSPVLTEVLSDVFSVYTAKDFPGMRPSSALTRALKLQGCNIQVKKGNERALARKRQSFDSTEDREDAENVKRRKNTA